MRIKILVAFFVLLSALAVPAAADDGDALTTVILVRHAEKTLDAEDPPLTPEGEERARHLAYMLSALHVDAVYSTPFQRTRATAEPLAKRLGAEISLTPATPTYAADMARRIREEHEGEVVVVVGHSNTTPDVLRALGAEGVAEIPESDYDNLFVVTFAKGGPPRLLPLRF